MDASILEDRELGDEQQHTSMSDTSSSQQSSAANPSIGKEPPAVGTVNRDGSNSESKGDFAIKLETLIEAGSKTGYMATVRRAVDGLERKCFFTMESTSHKSKFLAQINNSFGSGGMSLAFNEAQFTMFIQFLKQDSADNLNIRRAVTRVGEQQDRMLWVLGDGIQVNSHGILVPEEQQIFIWLEWSIVQGLGSISLKEVLPRIVLPLSTTSLSRALQLLQLIMKHNFISAILIMASGIMALHFSTIIISSGCPIPVAYGASQTGKSPAMTVALSIMGLPRDSIYERVTNAFILERSSVSTLPFGVDDPSASTSKQYNLSDVIVDLYNGGRSASMRKGVTCALSVPIVAINHLLLQEERVQSRVCVIPFNKPSVGPQTEDEQMAFNELDDIPGENEISSCVGWAIKLQKLLSSKDDVREMRGLIMGSFTGRSAHNWAPLLLCTKELLIEAGWEDTFVNVLDFVRNLGDKDSSAEKGTTSKAEEVISTTLEDILAHASGKSLEMVLQYMQTDVSVEGKDTFVVVLNAITNLKYSISEIRRAIIQGHYGSTNVSKDFLLLGETDTRVKRGKSSTERRCDAIYLQAIPTTISDRLVTLTQPPENLPPQLSHSLSAPISGSAEGS